MIYFVGFQLLFRGWSVDKKKYRRNISFENYTRVKFHQNRRFRLSDDIMFLETSEIYLARREFCNISSDLSIFKRNPGETNNKFITSQ